MTTHYMLDIETLGTQPDAVVLSIGMVAFTAAHGITGRWYARVDIDDQLASGAKIDASTLAWWATQDRSAQIEAFAPGNDRLCPWLALSRLCTFFEEQRGDMHARVWANAPAFDCTILRRMAARCTYPVRWDYRDERCYRTVRAIYNDVAPVASGLGAHHALDDAEYQAVQLMEIAQAHPEVLA